MREKHAFFKQNFGTIEKKEYFRPVDHFSVLSLYFPFSLILFSYALFLCGLFGSCKDDEQEVSTLIRAKTRDLRLEGQWHEEVELNGMQLHYVHRFQSATGQYVYHEQGHSQRPTQKYYYTEGEKLHLVRPGEGLKRGRSEQATDYWFSPQLDTLYMGESANPQRLFRENK